MRCRRTDCHREIRADARSDAAFCSAVCRATHHREEMKRRGQDAFDLLIRQTRAVIEGDPEALAAVQRDAEGVFGREYREGLTAKH